MNAPCQLVSTFDLHHLYEMFNNQEIIHDSLFLEQSILYKPRFERGSLREKA